MNSLTVRTSENSYLHIAQSIPVYASTVKLVAPELTCANWGEQENLKLFESISEILKDKPNYSDVVVYKLLELDHIATESGILLLTNSYNMRLSNTVVQDILKVIN